jgi:hypothetical protein
MPNLTRRSFIASLIAAPFISKPRTTFNKLNISWSKKLSWMHPDQIKFYNSTERNVLWTGGRPNRAANKELQKLIRILEKDKNESLGTIP